MRTPKPRVETVTVWDCGNPAHRHKSESVAQRCIDSQPKNRLPSIHARRAMWLLVARAVLDGATLKEAGAIVGVTAERARQMFCKVTRKSLHPSLGIELPEWAYHTSTQAQRDSRDHWHKRFDALEKSWGLS